jgi:tetratricopeptide (TPR) repeat protein
MREWRRSIWSTGAWLVLSAVLALGQGATAISALLSIEDPAARIVALESFLGPRTSAADRQTAREAIVASHAQLAERHLRENNIERAVRHFRDAIERLPETIPDPFFVSTVIRIPQATSMRGYRTEAVLLARSIEKRASVADDSRKLGAIGEYYLTIEASADAIRTLEAAVRIVPTEIELRRLLASAYRMGLQLDEAVAEYQRILGQAPTDGRALYELANLYRAHGAYEEAIALYQQRLEREPRHEPSLKGLVIAYLALGDPGQQGAAALARLRQGAPTPEEATRDVSFQTQLAFHYLLQTQSNRNRLQEAREAADAALAIEPRYAWARIAAAEVALAEERYLDAERHLLTALSYANFPTLRWTLGKVYLAVEDFEGAREQFSQVFQPVANGEFEATLGGVRTVRTRSLRTLFALEHQAAIFLATSPTSHDTSRVIEALIRLESGLADWTRPAKPGSGDRAALLQLVEQFVVASPERQAFRSLYAAERLIGTGTLLDKAIEMANRVLAEAETATEPAGSLRDYPNYDREGRVAILRGRAWDRKGWAYYKAENLAAADAALLEAIQSYGDLPEVRRSFWHLATVRETAGDQASALALYLAGYEPPATPPEKGGAGGEKADVRRTIIELLFRQVRGSLDKLEAELARASVNPYELLASVRGVAIPSPVAKTAPAPAAAPVEADSALLVLRERLDRSSKASGENSGSVSRISLPRSDPMFARREEVPQRAERPVPPLAIEPAPVVSPPPAPAKPAAAAPRSAPPGTVVAALAQAKEEAPVEKPAVVPAKPAPPRPIQLPAAIALRFALTDPLTPFFNQERYFSRWNGVRLVNAESPPAPVAIQEKIPSSTNPATSGPRPATRPRWATRKDLPSSPVPKGIK